MRRSIALAIALTTLWFVGSVWYYDCKIKRVCGPTVLVEAAPAAVPIPAPQPHPEPATVVTQTAPIALAPSTPAPPPAAAVQPLVFTAYFGRKSTEIVIPSASQALLPQLLQGVAQGQRVRVVGHSDARGSAALKAELSAQRAVILKDWLKTQGVPEQAFVALESQEDREPVADNATAEGRAQNRRAVATLQE